MTSLSQQRVRTALAHVGVWLAYWLLAMVATWPLATSLVTHVIDAPYSWDALTNTMIMGTRVHNAIGIGAGGAYDAYFFAPIPHTIAFNENLFGLSLLFAPIYLVTHEPILSYNLVLLWSLSLSGYFTFWLVRRLALQMPGVSATAATLPAFGAGIAFAFCPYAVFEVGRIQLVATQWLPLCLLMLHRGLASRRWADFLGLGLAFAMQVGTCLYYALFLAPILGLLLIVSAWRDRAWNVRLVAQLVSAGALAAALIVPMVLPYFEVREHFDLTRDEEYAQSFDGKLSFLANVHTWNNVWRPLRHKFMGAGAHEEIAFPGLTVALLALLAVLGPLLVALRDVDAQRRKRLVATLLFLLSCATIGSLGATAATGTLIAGALVLLVAYAHWRVTAGDLRATPPVASLYAAAGLFALGLFLGIEPMRVNGQPVHGLYYYLFAYVPGFDGIRKVSRQAIVVMLMFAVLAGIGGAWCIERLRNTRARWGAGLVLCALAFVETLSLPMRLSAVPTGAGVPSVYALIARGKDAGPIAVIPARDGKRLYHGHPGQALHNYESLYHRRRMINGKSSWIPPVTRLFDDYMNRFPNPTATKLLLALGTRQLVVHAGDYTPERAQRVLAFLDADTDHYQLIARQGSDNVYRMKTASEDEGWLIPTPVIPSGAVPLPREALSLTASINPARIRDAIDGDPATRWSTLRVQRGGDFVEIRLNDTRPVVALEIEPGDHTLEVPLSFELSVAPVPAPGAAVGAVFEPVLIRPRVFVYKDQVYAPKRFVWRVVLPKPIAASRLRLKVREPVASQWWSIPELKVWVRGGRS